MWRLILILLQILAISDGKQSARIYSWGNASAAAIDEDYYLVSKNNSHISISRQFNDETVKTCYLDFHDSHVGRIQTVTIERKIVLLFRQNATTFKLLQLDPFLCLYHLLTSLESSVESDLEPKIILVNNTVDIFLKGHKNCLPCRFDVNGNRLGVTGQLAPNAFLLFKSFIIKGFLQKEDFHNYALVGNFTDGTSVLKILDYNLSTKKEKYFDHPIEALAANSDPNHSWIGITYAGPGNPRDRVLAMYTSDLELLYENRVEPLTDGSEIYDTLLSINSIGHCAIHFREHSVDWQYAILKVYDQKGSVMFNIRITNFWRSVKYDWQLFTHNLQFCAATHEYRRSDTDSWFRWH